MLENLNIDNVKVGVGISTYTMDDTPKERFDIIKRSFDSPVFIQPNEIGEQTHNHHSLKCANHEHLQHHLVHLQF